MLSPSCLNSPHVYPHGLICILASMRMRRGRMMACPIGLHITSTHCVECHEGFMPALDAVHVAMALISIRGRVFVTPVDMVESLESRKEPVESSSDDVCWPC